MRRLVICVMSLLATSSVFAQYPESTYDPEYIRLGAFYGGTQGGDIGKDDTIIGGHLIWQVDDSISIELAGYTFEDSTVNRITFPDPALLDLPPLFTAEIVDAEKLDITAATLVIRARFTLLSRLKIYGAAGVGFYDFDSSASRTADSEELGRALFGAPGIQVDSQISVDHDPSISLITGVGLELSLTRNFELFADYRYNFVDREGKISETRTLTQGEIENTITADTNFKQKYDHGIFRVGANLVF